MELARIREAVGVLKAELNSLVPSMVDPGMAQRLIEALSEGSRACSSATALLASRVGDPDRLARDLGTSIGRARAVSDLSNQLKRTPALDRAMRDGALSVDQATEISKAEAVVPGSADHLVEVARSEPFHELKRQARQAILDADRARLPDRQRRARRAAHWVTPLGMVHIEADLEPHIGAPIVECLDADARRMAKSGVEPFQHHLADAVAEALGGNGSAPSSRSDVVVLVSHEVAERGWIDVRDDEHCHIVGVGPIGPQTAKGIADDAFLSGVLFDGKDLRHIKTWGRHVPAPVRLALRLGPGPEFDGPRCIDCGNRLQLELDHQTPLSEGGPTSFDNLEPRCEKCHLAKTRRERRRRRLDRAASGVSAGVSGAVQERSPP
ncbi:MAG: HNH endonuclease signature motif containing protein [Acidimicrobiia bacterium]